MVQCTNEDGCDIMPSVSGSTRSAAVGKWNRREAPEGELVGQSTVRITHNGKTETVSKDAASVQRYLLTLSPTEKTP